MEGGGAAAAAPAASSMLTGLNSGVVLSLIAVAWTVLWQNLHLQQFLARHLRRHARRLAAMVDPYLSLTIAEYEGGRMKRSDVYEEVKAYLSDASARDARHLRAEGAKDANKLVLSMSDGEEVQDEFQDAKVWWSAYSNPPPRSDGAAAWWGGGGGVAQEERRFYRIYFLERHRSLVLDTYLPRVRQLGREVMVQNRQRKLFTNVCDMRSAWSHVTFEHPMTFDTLAMDPVEKKKIKDDLNMFKNGKDYYARVGKAWKRGYLLHGPPGTGKSAMIAAMANHLDYDIYDIELTSVHSNTELRKLFIQTTSKSIIVIEDIDCSLDLTGARKKKETEDDEKDKKDGGASKPGVKKDTSSKVTLSGLLNFIDGLWSACGGERIIVFTTNHFDKLDPALIRRGRMDYRIKMSYCGFAAFKSLAETYLDVNSHPLFDTIGQLLQEVEMTPADVAENLTPKSVDDSTDSRLADLVEALKEAKAEKGSGGDQQNQQDEKEQ